MQYWQRYSQPASPYWLSKLFVALAVPADSPLWTATENQGPWESLGDRVANVYLPGPGLHVSNHGPSGAAEIRPGKVGARRADMLYTRLAYSTLVFAKNEE